MKKKKILFVNASLSNGGSERVMVLLANELSSRNFDVSMIVLDSDKETYKPRDNVRIIKIDTKNAKTKIKKRLLQIMGIRKIIKTHAFSNVISFMQEVNVITLIASFGINQQIIVSERCNPEVRKKDIWYYLAKLLYKKSKTVVIQTEQVRNMLFKNIRKKCAVIPNPVNNDIPDQYIGKRKKVIVAAGRLTEQKNFNLLIDAFSDVCKKHSDYILKIYGKGPLYKELTDYINQKDLSANVKLMGFVEDLNNQMNSASMYVSTSNYEGISNTMIESLAMGIPTICTDCPVGGASLMIKHEKNGVLIPVGDKEKLVYYMNKIIEEKSFSEYISNNAVKVKKEYSVKNIADKWVDLL